MAILAQIGEALRRAPRSKALTGEEHVYLPLEQAVAIEALIADLVERAW